ncbi:hypothetical protein CSA37_13050 [Candidatus Fermentibacteria bacterium]|nr:MAG: hypothetical protein CSA37_13050 [Candidatus Fermentibacteria bacterium]
MKGGILGTEIRLIDSDEIACYAFTRLPSVIEGSSMYMGVGGYRPSSALKTGLGLGFGLDYQWDCWRVSCVLITIKASTLTVWL